MIRFFFPQWPISRPKLLPEHLRRCGFDPPIRARLIRPLISPQKDQPRPPGSPPLPFQLADEALLPNLAGVQNDGEVVRAGVQRQLQVGHLRHREEPEGMGRSDLKYD